MRGKQIKNRKLSGETIASGSFFTFPLPEQPVSNDSYSRDLSAKVRSQLEIKQKDGKFIGSFAPYGYEKDERDRNHLQIDPYAAGVVRDIFLWRISGMSNGKIADRLNQLGVLPPAEYKRVRGFPYQTGFEGDGGPRWHPVAVARILANETYLGWVVQGKKTRVSYKVKKLVEKPPQDWLRVSGMHEPVVTEEMFLAAQTLAAMDTRAAPGGSRVFRLSGLVVCGGCQGNMVRKVASAGKGKAGGVRKYPYYICAGHKQDPGWCSSHRVREKDLETVIFTVLDSYMGCLADPGQILQWKGGGTREREAMEDRIGTARKEAANRHRLIFALRQDWEAGLLDQEEYQGLKQVYARQAVQYEREGARLEKEKGALEREGAAGFLSRPFLLAMLKTAEVAGKKRIRLSFRFSRSCGGGKCPQGPASVGRLRGGGGGGCGQKKPETRQREGR